MSKEGPDNLWALKKDEYLLVECKNEVEINRVEINKDECTQLNSSVAWFQKNYKSCKSTNIIIIPTYKIARSASLLFETYVMRVNELRIFKDNISNFYSEFNGVELNDLSEKRIHKLLEMHDLTVDSIKNK